MAGDPVVRLSEDFADGVALRDAAKRQGLEGVVAKRVDSPYRPGRRSPDWVKRKERLDEEFLIAGFTEGKGTRGAIGALVLGVHADGGLVYAGNVGSGFTEDELRRLRDLLGPLARTDSPFGPGTPRPRPARERVTWVEPRLVCQVEFAEWTSDGRLRAPVYLGPARRRRSRGRPSRDAARPSPDPRRAATCGSPTATRCSSPTRASPRATWSTTTAPWPRPWCPTCATGPSR